MNKLKLISIILFFLCGLAYADDTNKTKEEVRIIKGTSITEEVDRSVFSYINVYYVQKLNLVEIIYDGIGDADVYVLDCHGNIISMNALLEGNNVCYIDLPTISGTYFIIIVSDKFYGEGKITID